MVSSIAVLFAAILLWHIISIVNLFPAYAFPSPAMVFASFIEEIVAGRLLNDIVASLWRVVVGFVLSLSGTLLFMYNQLSAFWWMTITGVGLYMGYVPFNCMLFERMIASFRYVSNACFIIYVADSFGYLGSDVVLLVKNFSNSNISYSDFFVKMIVSISALGIGLTILSSIYFRRKYQRYFSPSSNLSYA